MSIRLTIVCILALAFGYCVTADAQTVQPTYVRPSKGKSLQVFNSPVTTTSTFVEDSAVYDWSAFSGVAFTLDRVSGTFGAECERGLRIKVYGGPSTNKADFKALDAKNGYYNASGDAAWYVPVLTPYIYVKFSKWTTGGVGTCPLPVTVSMTPIPFDVTHMGPRTTWQANVLDGIGSTLTPIQVSGVTPTLRIHNYGTSVVMCGFPTVDGTTPSPASFPILLSAGDALEDGKGASIEFNEFAGKIMCRAVSSVAAYRIAFFAY